MNLTNLELEKLSKKLEEIEWQLLNDYGLRKLNGGFVIAEMFDYDDEIIDIEITSGIEGEEQTTEQLQLDRETFEFIK